MNAKHWQQSYMGKIVTPELLCVEQVSYEDIAHALAQKIRFNGQCTVMGYTVAQHCVMGALEVARVSPKHALPFLLHEVSEVYLPDVPSPIKRLLRVEISDSDLMNWTDLEDQHARVIFKALELSDLLPRIYEEPVKTADVRMLLTEKRDLMGPEPAPWIDMPKPYGGSIFPMEPKKAKQSFLDRFAELGGKS